MADGPPDSIGNECRSIPIPSVCSLWARIGGLPPLELSFLASDEIGVEERTFREYGTEGRTNKRHTTQCFTQSPEKSDVERLYRLSDGFLPCHGVDDQGGSTLVSKKLSLNLWDPAFQITMAMD